MTIRLLLATLAVAATPGLALAMCSGYGYTEANMSCPEGHAFDAESQSCKATPTG